MPYLVYNMHVNLIFILWRYNMTRTKSSRALLSVVLAVLMVAAFMPALTYSSFAATAKKATKVTKLNHTGTKVYGKVGSKYTLKYKLSPSKLTSAAQKTVWKSSDSSIVKVIATKGKHATVKVKGVGTAKVTVSTKANTKAKATWTFKTKKAETKKTTELTGVTVSAPNTTDDLSKVLKVGTVLKASVAPADAENVTYQWYAGDTAIDGATSAEYTVTAAEVGKAITVKATSKNDVTSTATAKVATPVLSEVKIADQTNATATAASVGDVLKATAKATSTGVNDAYEISDVTYQWYRGAVEAKNAIAGATSQTYTVTAADAGKTLTVVATPKTGVSGYPKEATPGITVKDTANYALTATSDAEGVKAVVKDAKTGTAVSSFDGYSFQWAESKDGTNFTAMPNQTAYNVATASLKTGYTYKVTVTGTPSGVTLDQTTATVKYTGKFLTAGTIVNVTANSRLDNANNVGDELQVKMADGLTYGTDYTVTWYRSDAANASALNTVKAKNLGTAQSYKLTSDDSGSNHVFAIVTGAGDYAGQTLDAVMYTGQTASTSAYTLAYDATTKAFKITDANGTAPASTATVNFYRYANGTTTVSKVTLTDNKVDTTAAEGYTYYATVKVGDKTSRTNGITFVTGQSPASVAVSGLITEPTA